MINKENKRTMLTLKKENFDKLKVIMFDLKTRQISKAINYLIQNYSKDQIKKIKQTYLEQK